MHTCLVHLHVIVYSLHFFMNTDLQRIFRATANQVNVWQVNTDDVAWIYVTTYLASYLLAELPT